MLDSHFALWLTLDRDLLRPAELMLLTDPANEVSVSAVSIWELKIKWERRFSSGERKGKAGPDHVLRLLRQLRVTLYDLTTDQASAVLRVPTSSTDPFDEQLLVHAQEMGMLLLSRDQKLVGHPLVLAP